MAGWPAATARGGPPAQCRVIHGGRACVVMRSPGAAGAAGPGACGASRLHRGVISPLISPL
ncbi:hypothetical protein X805_30060 [Sphaerotilus natans subsp. natans DSM 6575]|uniref:Uncharacterized protein n=1 Tax=Sphaerotilus natans subsp. natans DSM 6575 TaxID=1286631 RepID=A0A059KJX3_9BURK|nr:hypothetical protein X805_30060 [Sphaerotilus natans subsp. natans DSM 6575]